MLLSNFLEYIQCPNQLLNLLSIKKCAQNLYQTSLSAGTQSNNQEQLHNYLYHNHRIRQKSNSRHCDKMTKSDTNNGKRQKVMASTTTKALPQTSSSPSLSSLPSPLSIFSPMPLHSSYAAISMIIFFIVMLHCQIANGALSRDSYNSIYNNISINNVITVTNNTADAVVTVTDDGTDPVIVVDMNNNSEHNNATDDVYTNRYLFSRSKLRSSPIFQNEFAVYVPNGIDVADSIASKHGFSNMGQVSFNLIQ